MTRAGKVSWMSAKSPGESRHDPPDAQCDGRGVGKVVHLRRLRNTPLTRRVTMVVLGVALAAGLLMTPLLAARPTCLGAPATIIGSDRSERLVGTKGDDVIFAGAGSDYVLGKGGNDRICGATGADHLDAGTGAGRVNGGPGTDYIVGGSRVDTLDGGEGDDVFFTRSGLGGTIEGGRGSDLLTFVDRNCSKPVAVDLKGRSASYRSCAGASERRVWVVRGVENVEGGPGRDELGGGRGSNFIMGHERGDVIVGKDGNDRLLGGDGKDSLRGGVAHDALQGGTGYDWGYGGSGRDVCTEVEARKSC